MGRTSGWHTKAKARIGTVYAVWNEIRIGCTHTQSHKKVHAVLRDTLSVIVMLRHEQKPQTQTCGDTCYIQIDTCTCKHRYIHSNCHLNTLFTLPPQLLPLLATHLWVKHKVLGCAHVLVVRVGFIVHTRGLGGMLAGWDCWGHISSGEVHEGAAVMKSKGGQRCRTDRKSVA